MWEYIGPGDQSVKADGHLPEESLTDVTWMVLGAASGVPPVDGGLAPFLVFDLRPDDLPFLGEVTVPLSPGGQEEEGSCGTSPPPGSTCP
jgi:hypothetical protein